MKKTLLILTFGLMMAVSAKAQIFLQEGESDHRDETQPGYGIDLPGYGEATDFYAPVGSGVLMLAALSGAYLAYRKKNSKN